ncbi:MAG: FtsW/RodA/SpoVE family cell cycle protein, partial [Candidatus Saccharimonadales bacterium]|nr:FtsW/RodA/SpoVE family cell cycle protein [Candidatus Saccharimonadales bacterium]
MIRNQTLRRFDPFVTLPIVYLLGLSLVVLNSVDRTATRVEFDFGIQVLAVVIGAIVFLLATQTSAATWRRLGLWIYIAGLLSLVLVPAFGITVNGSTRWLEFSGFQFQPSELAKLGLIALQARLLATKTRSLDTPWSLILSMIYLALPAVLILMQPDLGTLVLLVVVWFGMLMMSTMRKRTLLLIAAALFLVVPVSYPFLADYQKERIDTFFSTSVDIQAEGYNVLQATIATG